MAVTEDNALREELKSLLIEDLMLQTSAEEIGDTMPLFGPESLGLDSVDALQLVVALDKKYGLKVPDSEKAKSMLYSIETIADAIEQRGLASGKREETET